MITLKSDQLIFSFPEIDESLHRLVESHIQATLPQLLAERRDEAIAVLERKDGFHHASVEEKKAAVEKVRNATTGEIASALRETCMAELPRRDRIATAQIEFERTLRIPDDGNIYPLPAGVGTFPLRHLDDFSDSVPESWRIRGGVMMPMHQSEALWLYFFAAYPFAVKVGAGKINAISGETWCAGLQRHPQDYLVLPEQPWLDGFSVGKGLIRQFVAMPLGDGYSVEEQLTGNADVGGIQLQVFPMKPEAYFRNQLADRLPAKLADVLAELVGSWIFNDYPAICCRAPAPSDAMGLGAGGTMRQEIYKDRNDFADWEITTTSRCFVHLCNSLVWRQITGGNPPHSPLTATEYAEEGIPWFDYYRDDRGAVDGSMRLSGVKSVAEMAHTKGASPLADNSTIVPELIVQYGNTRRPDEVREWVEF